MPISDDGGPRSPARMTRPQLVMPARHRWIARRGRRRTITFRSTSCAFPRRQSTKRFAPFPRPSSSASTASAPLRRHRSHAGVLTLALVIITSASGGARAHTVTPEEVVAKIASPPVREAYGILTVERAPEVPRLLVVRVGDKWNELPVTMREDAASDWLVLWRHAVAQGIVAVLDGKTGRPVINFDAQGRAVVKEIATPAL